jgi:hypothetical protein
MGRPVGGRPPDWGDAGGCTRFKHGRTLLLLKFKLAKFEMVFSCLKLFEYIITGLI